MLQRRIRSVERDLIGQAELVGSLRRVWMREARLSLIVAIVFGVLLALFAGWILLTTPSNAGQAAYILFFAFLLPVLSGVQHVRYFGKVAAFTEAVYSRLKAAQAHSYDMGITLLFDNGVWMEWVSGRSGLLHFRAAYDAAGVRILPLAADAGSIPRLGANPQTVATIGSKSGDIGLRNAVGQLNVQIGANAGIVTVFAQGPPATPTANKPPWIVEYRPGFRNWLLWADAIRGEIDDLANVLDAAWRVYGSRVADVHGLAGQPLPRTSPVSAGFARSNAGAPSKKPGARYSTRGTVLLFLGFLLAIVGFFGVVIGISYDYGFPSYDPVTGTQILGICGIGGLAPAILLSVIGIRDRHHARYLREIADYVTTYRRMELADLATKVRLPPSRVEALVTEAVGAGWMRGFIDSNTKEFVSQEVAAEEHFVGKCPDCGGNVDQWLLPGESVHCPYCGTLFATRVPKQISTPQQDAPIAVMLPPLAAAASDVAAAQAASRSIVPQFRLLLIGVILLLIGVVFVPFSTLGAVAFGGPGVAFVLIVLVWLAATKMRHH